MADQFTKEKRSEIMSKIRGKDTKPEMLVRKALHNMGFRYRLHDRSLPGKPDLKLTKFNALIQVHGCFWHAHDCHLFRPPKSNEDYWRPKINGNKKRDYINKTKLLRMNWRLLIVWECAIKGKAKLPLEDLIHDVSKWIIDGNKFKELRGKRQDN